MAAKTRYMDVLTIRSSQKSSALSQTGVAGSRTSKSHALLLVEPIVLPDMNHLTVDDAHEVNAPCLFYPTGAKNMSMRRSMEDMVRKVNAEDKPTRIVKSSLILTSPKKKKVLDPTMPLEPLVYTKKKSDVDADVAYLMSKKHVNERNLRSTYLGVHTC